MAGDGEEDVGGLPAGGGEVRGGGRRERRAERRGRGAPGARQGRAAERPQAKFLGAGTGGVGGENLGWR